MKKTLAIVVILVCLASSAFGQRVLTLLEPVGLETWVTGSHDVRWQRTGSGWTPTDTIKIQYSDDSGATWPEDAQHIVTSATQASADYYPWDITAMPISPYYRVRITCNEQPSATSQSTTGSCAAQAGEDEQDVPVEKSLAPRVSAAGVSADVDYLPSGLRASLVQQQQQVAAASAPLGVKASFPLHALGLIPSDPSQVPSASKVVQQIEGTRRAKGAGAKSPSSWDNSSGLPPVGDQGAQGSCVSWVTGYYMKTYQEAKEHGWSLTDSAHQFSPRFLYNQLQGFDEGTTFEQNLGLLNDQGCAPLANEPYVGTDYLTYPTAASYRAAIPFRAQSYEYLGDGDTVGLFDAVKAILSNGDVVGVGIPIYRPNSTTHGRFDNLTSSDNRYQMPAPEDVYNAGYHALTIVGYDESAFDGQGGYKVINSWGDSWGDHGFAWLSESFLTSFGFGFYRMADRVNYNPTSMIHWKVAHYFWGWNYDNVTVTVGVGSTTSPLWSKVMVTQLERESLTIDMWFDISDGAAYLPPDWTNRWWLSVGDSSRDDSATLSILELEHNGTTDTAAAVIPLSGPILLGTLYAYIPAGNTPSTNYYVNNVYDSASDIYCTASGNDANDGLTPSTPKRTVQALIDLYTLRAGDVVWIDAGTYDITSDISLTQLDRGADATPLRFVGALASNGEPATVLTRTGTSGASFNLNTGARFVELKDLWLKGGESGVSFSGDWQYWEDGLTLENVRITDVSGSACALYEASGTILAHCQLYRFLGTGVSARMSEVTVRQSLIDGGVNHTCIFMDSSDWNYASGAHLTLAGSILTTSGSTSLIWWDWDYCSLNGAKYNDLVATNGALLSSAKTGVGNPGVFDSTNLYLDPLFAAAISGDYHSKSAGGRWDPTAGSGNGGWVFDTVTSPCIDTGDPAADFSSEPLPNGGRVNIGSHGGTNQASRTPATRVLILLEPRGGEVWPTGNRTIRWLRIGSDWTPADTLTIEYSADGGGSWNTISTTANAATGTFTWDVTGFTPSLYYQVRVTCNQDSAGTDTSANFQIGNMAFYVNDGYTLNDKWCTGPGLSTNNGLSKAEPNTSVQYIIATYDLQPGDTVYVDAGTYVLQSNITIDAADAGASGSSLVFLGATEQDGTRLAVLDRNEPGTSTSRVFDVSANYVRLEGLCCTGGYYGISLNATGDEARRCEVYGCGNIGVKVVGSSNKVTDCLVYDNTGDGVDCHPGVYQSAAVTGNTVRNNTGYGIVAVDWRGSVTVSHNVSVNNHLSGLYMSSRYEGTVAAVNNTLAGNGSHGAYYYYDSGGSCNFRNNIVHTDVAGKVCFYISSTLSGTFNYNTYYATGGAGLGYNAGATRSTLGAWRRSTGQDANSLDVNPLFVDPANGDYHLQSTAGSWHRGSWSVDTGDSPCIDMGNPADAMGAEPSPNGSRINAGYDGGTNQASRTPNARLLTLLEPRGGEVWPTGNETIRWQCTGSAWTKPDTLTIEYSADAGGSWTTIATTEDAATGTFTWDVTALTPGIFYRVRVTLNQDHSATDISANFQIGRMAFYVNDGYTLNDKWCTGPGLSTNNGLSKAEPNTSVQYIIGTYDLQPGDTVYVDAGTYVLQSNITIDAADAGASASPLVFLGATEQDGTRLAVLDRNEPGTSTSRVFDVSANYVRLEGLRCTGGYYGISLNATGDEARSCEVHDCRNSGVYVVGNVNAVAACLVYDNTGYGINCQPGVYQSAAVTGNTVRNNTANGILARAWRGSVTVSHNLSVNNGVVGLYMQSSYAGTVEAVNNTLAGNGSNGAYYNYYSGGSCNFRNNIVHTDVAGKVCFYIGSTLSGTFNYNTYYATGGAGVGYNAGATCSTLGEWRTSTGKDANSLDVDPLFVDPVSGDYHVMSTEGSYHDGLWLDDAQDSPTIDAGQPDTTWPYDYTLESCPNGSRINQGFDGGTAQASKTPGEHPTVVSVTAVTLRSIDVTFSHAMGVGVTDPDNYTLSGAGMGNLAVHPDSVVLSLGNTYTLTWNGGEMRNGATATVTVAPVVNVQDLLCYHVDENANSGQTPGIGVPPTITVNPLTTRDRTPLLSGTIQDNDSGICGCQITVDGHVYTAIVNGTNWSGQVTDLLDGDPAHTYDVDARATDCAGNTALDPTSGELTIDIHEPTTCDAILLTDPTPTNAQTVHFTAYFSMHVQNVQVSDFVIDAVGGVTGATVTAVQVVGGSDNMQWTVTVNTGAGDGSVSIDLVDGDHSIVDIDGYPLGGSFVNGQVYQIDKTAPTATIVRADPPVTDLNTVTFTVTFDEDVVGFDAADVVPTTGSVPVQLPVEVIGGPMIFQVRLTVANAEDDGALGFTIPVPPSVVTDLAGNPYAGGTSPEYGIHNWHGFTRCAEPPELRLYSGDSHTYTVECSHGNSTPTYQWEKDGVPLSGATSPSYSIDGADPQDTGSYLCRVSYDGFAYTCDPPVTLEVADHLSIVQLDPVSTTKDVGDEHTFFVTTSGGFEPLHYTWKKDGTNVAGTTDSFYTIDSVQTSDDGSYVVEVNDDETDVMVSNTATLVVDPDPGLPAAGVFGLAAVLGLSLLAGFVTLRRKD